MTREELYQEIGDLLSMYNEAIRKSSEIHALHEMRLIEIEKRIKKAEKQIKEQIQAKWN